MNNKEIQKRPIEQIIIGRTDVFRRHNLLRNIVSGFGTYVQSGDDVKYTVGSEKHGIFKYLIIDMKI